MRAFKKRTGGMKRGSVQRLFVKEIEIDRNTMAQPQGYGRAAVKDETQRPEPVKLPPKGPLGRRKRIKMRVENRVHANLRTGIGGTFSGSARPSR